MDKSLRAWNEDQAEAMAREAGYLQFNRARRAVRETRKNAAATWPALLEGAPEGVRDTVKARLAAMG